MEPLSLVPLELNELLTKVSILHGSYTYTMLYMHPRLCLCLPIKILHRSPLLLYHLKDRVPPNIRPHRKVFQKLPSLSSHNLRTGLTRYGLSTSVLSKSWTYASF
jgi:hypothetical protein